MYIVLYLFCETRVSAKKWHNKMEKNRQDRVPASASYSRVMIRSTRYDNETDRLQWSKRSCNMDQGCRFYAAMRYVAKRGFVDPL